MSPTTIKVENGNFKGISVNDFPCIAEQNAMQNVLVDMIQKSLPFVTQYYQSVWTNFVQSKYFAMQKCWMKTFPVFWATVAG